jgi:hypothetical protein
MEVLGAGSLRHPEQFSSNEGHANDYLDSKGESRAVGARRRL